MDIDQLVVIVIHKAVVPVQHVGKTTGHAGTEVESGATQHHHHATSHILATVIAHPFHHCASTRVTHRKPLASQTRGQQVTTSSTVQTGVTDDGGLMAGKDTAVRRIDDQLATGHPLAHIVIGVPFQIHMQTTGIPHPEALPRGSLQMQCYGGLLHAEVTVPPGNLAGEARADGAMDVSQLIVKTASIPVVDGRQCITNHLLGQLTLVERPVARLNTESWLVLIHTAVTQNRRQIELLLFAGVTGQHLEQIGTANYLIQTAITHLCQQFAHLFSNETDVVHHHLHPADIVLFTQHRVLGGNAGSTVVQMADTQIFTADGNHRRSTKTETLRPEQRSLDHIQPGLETTIGLYPHLVTEIIGAQDLVGLGKAQLPRRPGIFHRGQRTGTGAAVIAGDGDQISVSLGNSGGNGADTGLGHQFDGDQRLGINLLQIKNELGQILDGVDIMVRRRRNKRHTGFAVTQLGNQLIYLAAGQLPSLTGLGPLGDFDLDHLSTGEIGRRYTEPP